MDKTIYIIGFMGSGKTYLGEKIAKKFNLPFYDLDNIISNISKMTIQELFVKKGEKYFRKLEKEVLLNTHFKGIVACGGGIIEEKQNREYLKLKNTVWLNEKWETIWDRIKFSNRPLVKTLDEINLKKLYIKRQKLYQSVAVYTIEYNFERELSNLISLLFHVD